LKPRFPLELELELELVAAALELDDAGPLVLMLACAVVDNTGTMLVVFGLAVWPVVLDDATPLSEAADDKAAPPVVVAAAALVSTGLPTVLMVKTPLLAVCSVYVPSPRLNAPVLPIVFPPEVATSSKPEPNMMMVFGIQLILKEEAKFTVLPVKGEVNVSARVVLARARRERR
jgi:hypothetical protein